MTLKEKLRGVKGAVFKKRRVLNPKKDEDLVILLERERAMYAASAPGLFERRFIKQCENDMARAVRKALKDGETPTVENLIKTLDEHPLVAKFYEGLGFKRDFYVGLAEKAIATGGKMEAEPKREKIGRNDPCPCGSGKKYKHCCGR
jgi:hypothetical protein